MTSAAPGENIEVTSSWYAVYTRHQHEKVVANHLRSKGFEVFLPLYTAGHQWKDRRKVLSLPLFPCYVFLHSSLRQRVEVLRTPGVHQFVGFGGVPCPIPAEEIEAVQCAVGSSLAVEPHPFSSCGDRVRVKAGALAGAEGILVRTKSRYRLVLSIELLNRSVAVEVDLSQVERLTSPVADSVFDTGLHGAETSVVSGS
jgi:transcription antitermination factor NusG